MTPIAALLLAGGAATRLGGLDKPMLNLAGRPVLDWVRRAVPPGAPVAISANGDPARFAALNLPALDLPVLADGEFAGQGPLAGLLAGLDWAAGQGAQALLSLPGDTPFLPADLAARLDPAAAYATYAGRAHSLAALWPVAARAELRALLGNPGGRAVARFAAALGARAVACDDLPEESFLNINTPEDLTAARRIAERMA